jgi:S1-C subfamily serine protease
LSQYAAGVASEGGDVERTHATVIVTDARISGGDSGGPLLNEKGNLIGLTFATSANSTAGSVGWHITLDHVREFVADLPEDPEGVPFDLWSAGLPNSARVAELSDADEDGRTV